MSQIPNGLQSEIFLRKPYLKNYFSNLDEFSYEYAIDNYVSLNGSPYSLKKNKSNYFSLFFKGKPLASIYDPIKQAKRVLDGIQFFEKYLIIVLGMGNPYLMRMIHSSCPTNQIIIFIDIAEDLVPILWNHVLEEILSVPGRHVFSGENFIPLLWNYLDGLDTVRMTGIKFLKNTDSIRLAPEFYNNIENTISTAFSTKMSDLLTKFEFENLWIGNIISNTILFNFNQDLKIKNYEGILKGIPGVLLSAGPSLKTQLPYLKKFRDKVFIMACDTALKVLLKFNITPDAVFTLDAQMNSLFHFLGEDLKSILCFADMVSSPYLLDSIQFQNIVFSMTTKYVHTVEGVIQREITAGGEFTESFLGELGEIQSGGSVATSAFEALRFMGVKEFYFLGQDLAYTGREIHSTGTHHNEKWLGLIHRRKSLEYINESIIRKRDTRYVESVDGKRVITDYVLDLYRSWFEDSISTLKIQNEDYRFINFSNHGARINGIKNIPIEDSIEVFSSLKYHDYKWKEVFLSNCEHFRNLTNNSRLGNVNNSINIIIKNQLISDFINLYQLFEELENSPNWENLLSDWFKSRIYLHKLLRKTETYINRHKNKLDQTRVKRLYLDTLKREFKRLKRKLYPILGLEFLGGSNFIES